MDNFSCPRQMKLYKQGFWQIATWTRLGSSDFRHTQSPTASKYEKVQRWILAISSNVCKCFEFAHKFDFLHFVHLPFCNPADGIAFSCSEPCASRCTGRVSAFLNPVPSRPFCMGKHKTILNILVKYYVVLLSHGPSKLKQTGLMKHM